VTSWQPLDDPLGLVRALSGFAAPAGHEDRLTQAVSDHLTARGLHPVVDRLGQVAVTVEGTRASAPSTLVSAHLDELGLIVRAVDPDGWLRVHRLGGMPERVLPATRLLVHTRAGDLPAVVGTKSHHLTPPEEKYIARPATDLYLDIGVESAEQAHALGVRVGDPITYAPEWDELAGGRFAGKSLDDRVGVAALLGYLDRLLADPPPVTTHVAFTTQEEFHVRGTLALVARFTPDMVVNLDVAPATDTPDLAGVGSVRLGGGPTLSRLSFHGRGTLGGLIPHPALADAVEAAADAAGTGLQPEATIGVITDAAFVPMATADGIAAVGVGIPVRYTHAPIETGQLSDLVGATELLVALTERIGEVDLSRGTPRTRNGGNE
jgi:putative aminopeptidase